MSCQTSAIGLAIGVSSSLEGSVCVPLSDSSCRRCLSRSCLAVAALFFLSLASLACIAWLFVFLPAILKAVDDFFVVGFFFVVFFFVAGAGDAAFFFDAAVCVVVSFLFAFPFDAVALFFVGAGPVRINEFFHARRISKILVVSLLKTVMLA